jgi:hypothetical protein
MIFINETQEKELLDLFNRITDVEVRRQILLLIKHLVEKQ